MSSAQNLSEPPLARGSSQNSTLLDEIHTLQSAFTEFTGPDTWGRLLTKVDSYTAPHVQVHPWVVSYRSTSEREDLFSFLTDTEKLSTCSLADVTAADAKLIERGTRVRRQDLPTGDPRLNQHAWAAMFVAGERITGTQERQCAEVRYYDPNTSEADVPNPGAEQFRRVGHAGWLQHFHQKKVTKWWRWCKPEFQRTTNEGCQQLDFDAVDTTEGSVGQGEKSEKLDEVARESGNPQMGSATV
ncbi:hypothetical protein C8R46DRAFT_1035320 [Mycena filopes]|nr:hypothetical protein C8R46DRAFT_1035320 [Mycena filopes]